MIIIYIFLGLIYGYLVGTYLESFIHDKIMHSTFVHKFAFNRTKVSHEEIHHLKTFKTNHITQFSSKQEEKELDIFLNNKYHSDFARWVKKENYGMTLTNYSLLLHNLPFLPIIIITYLYSNYIFFYCSLIPIIFVSIMSKYFHSYFHCSFNEAMNTAPFLTRIILDTPIMRRVWRLHYVHHKQKKFNFNLLLGGDWLRGVLKEPNKEQLDDMKKLGLPMN